MQIHDPSAAGPVELTADELDAVIRRAVEDSRGGVAGPLLVGSILLVLGLGLASLAMRDRVKEGLAGVAPQIESLRTEVRELREVSAAAEAVPTSVTVGVPMPADVATQAATAQHVESVAAADHAEELTARRERLRRQRDDFVRTLDEMAAGGRVLKPGEVRAVVARLYDEQLAWLSGERDAAEELSRRQEAIGGAVLSGDADSEAFVAPLMDNVQRQMGSPAVEGVPADEAAPAVDEEPAAKGLPAGGPKPSVDAPPSRRLTVPPTFRKKSETAMFGRGRRG